MTRANDSEIELRHSRVGGNPSFSERLLSWFDTAGRKHLPWQQDTTPYRVWISEIMLQQTQVATVIPYYARFMQRFTDVQALANAPIDEVLHLWTGLGYYARARNLHRTAQTIVQDHGGEFPQTLDAMQALSGIGRSTAAAILSIACNQRQPILDGNVKRVLTRYFGIAGFPGEKRIDTQLWKLADDCTSQERVADYTQAIMDLGATVCMRTRPKCDACPVSSDCVAYRDNLQSILPTRRPKRVRPQRKAFVLVAINAQGAVLLERRPPSGIWGGLWTFPQYDSEDAAMNHALTLRFLLSSPSVEESTQHFTSLSASPGLNDCVTPAKAGVYPKDMDSRLRGNDESDTVKLGVAVEGRGEGLPTSLPLYHHAFTHFDLELQPLLLRNASLQQVADSDKHCWYDPANPPRIGLATPVVEIIRRVMAMDDSRAFLTTAYSP